MLTIYVLMIIILNVSIYIKRMLIMKKITDIQVTKQPRPIKAVQFGEGNFLRAFVDCMLDIANEKGVFGGDIAILKPISFGSLESFKEQNNLYTVVLRGKMNGEVVNSGRIITSVSKALDCKEDYDEYMALSRLDSLRFVISNTTEAGITLDRNDHFDSLPETYPGKLTKFLYERYNTFSGAADKGLIIIPVELIEDNGKKLRECILALCDCWNLGSDFKNWVNDACIFCNTLVDRIVTGYPRNEAENIYEEIGYTDKLLDVGEPFALWVIECEKDISDELPLDKIGLPVVFTKNQRPYRERKVRILNGAHTSSVLGAYLSGFDIVRDCMEDEVIGKFVRDVVLKEIAPQVKLPADEVKEFAESVFERFENPFIDHSLLAISLNSVSKWKVRVLPSFKDYYNKNASLPRLLTFSFAALLAFYRSNDLRDGTLYSKRANGDSYEIHDDAEVLQFFAENSSLATKDFVSTIASNTKLWDEDLSLYNGFVDEVVTLVDEIEKNALSAFKKILGE